jgi:tetratricopeptide (TPR) repeat protein
MRIPLLFLVALTLSACASGPSSLPPPQFDPDELLARNTSGLDATVYQDERFWLNPDMVMRHFVDISVQDVEQGNVPVALLKSLRAEWSSLNYSRNANFTARDAFQERQANCLSFSAMVVSLMRHAGVRAQFQRVEAAPEWDMEGGAVVAALHINAVIFQNGKRSEVDWLPRRNASAYEKKYLLNDNEALAEWHNNLGTEALLADDLPLAFAELSRALRLAPEAAHIWVNLGVVYRRIGQPEHAEAAWLIALEHNQRQLQAISNLHNLYRSQQRLPLVEELGEPMLYYRKRNPFYHYLLAQEAEKESRFNDALGHLRRAQKLHQDIRFEQMSARLLSVMDDS